MGTSRAASVQKASCSRRGRRSLLPLSEAQSAMGRLDVKLAAFVGAPPIRVRGRRDAFTMFQRARDARTDRQNILALMLPFEGFRDHAACLDLATTGTRIIWVEIDIAFGLPIIRGRLNAGEIWASIPSAGDIRCTPSCLSWSLCDGPY